MPRSFSRRFSSTEERTLPSARFGAIGSTAVGTLSYPFILTSSSTRSISCLKSRRHEGISHEIFFAEAFVFIERFSRIAFISELENFKSSICPAFLGSKRILTGLYAFFLRSTLASSLPPASSFIRLSALHEAVSATVQPAPLSNLYDESVERFSDFEVLLMLCGLNIALSRI